MSNETTSNNWSWAPQQDMKGKTVIVTGANGGIGKETARALAGMGVSRLIMACRNLERGQAARDEISSSTGNQGVVLKLLDLGSMVSVRAFAEDVLANEERLDVLVNNAGILPPKERQVTSDGFELCVATNHLGHHLLTSILLPILRKSAPARVVVISSNAYKYGKLDLKDLQSEKSYSFFRVYAMTKLCNLIFANELAKRLQGSSVTVNSLHPGLIETNLFHGDSLASILRSVGKENEIIRVKNMAEGAETSVYLAAAQEVERVTGKFFENCQQVALTVDAADDLELARQLWEESDRLTGLISNVTQ